MPAPTGAHEVDGTIADVHDVPKCLDDWQA